MEFIYILESILYALWRCYCSHISIHNAPTPTQLRHEAEELYKSYSMNGLPVPEHVKKRAALARRRENSYLSKACKQPDKHDLEHKEAVRLQQAQLAKAFDKFCSIYDVPKDVVENLTWYDEDLLNYARRLDKPTVGSKD